MKEVGYGHHMRLRHGYRPSSSSDTTSEGEDPDDCQDFLLSPPHVPLIVSTEKKITKEKRENSSPLKLLPSTSSLEKSGYSTNSTTNNRICSPPYYVEHCKDLVLVLSKRNSNSMVNFFII